MSIRMRQHVERLIARRLILDGLRAGYTISVDNGEDGATMPAQNVTAIMAIMFETDEEYLIFQKTNGFRGWVRLIYGNDGWDVINDYTVNLDHIMGGANALADKYS